MANSLRNMARFSQVVSVLNSLFHFPVREGGLCDMWRRLADILRTWHVQIAAQAKDSAVLNADETGWRANSRTHRLWCFTSPTLTCYHVAPSRGSAVVNEFLGEMFQGTHLKWLKRYREALLRFLHDPAVPSDNNRTKREIRPAVISGKSSFHNTSNHGAQAQAALMSVYCTLKLRGHDPIETIRDALACHIGGGKLPPLPKLAASRLPYAPSEHSD
ncbi:MAG: transposase [Candidatus Sumerlaeota bacterium]|nr:transposase [Candidatus Sumerlaeota bacterium]